MATNLAKYETDLENLMLSGTRLLVAMQYELDPKAITKAYAAVHGDGIDKVMSELPSFKQNYQKWYSEAKIVVKQIIPDRLADFVRHYERAPRKVLEWDNYTIEDYLQGLSRRDIVPMSAGLSRMQQQLNILESAKERFRSSLFDIRQLVAADFFDSELDAAKMLMKNKFLRAAGAIGGVVLEKHLSQVCSNHNIKVNKKNPGIADFNELLKSANVIDIPSWRFVQHLSDIRNICDHDKKIEPTANQIDDLLSGVSKVIKTIF